MTFVELFRRFYWVPIVLGLGIALGVAQLTIARQGASIARYGAKMQHAADVMTITTERIRRARADARANDLAHAREIEGAQAKAAQETENVLLPALNAARADAVRYALRVRDALRAQAAGSGIGEPRLPYAPDATSDAVAAREKTQLDDTVACAEGIIKAQGWQDWWAKVRGWR